MEIKDKPLVVVWMVTYNHERYLAQAIESVMMQETDFNFQLLIGEDCSTDSTRAICEAFQQKYPEKIKLFLNEKNIGATPNGIQTYKRCFEIGAKYMALLEGDDYWTDASKLQKQVNFLEQHSECTFCFHNAFVEADDNQKNKESYPQNVAKEILEAKDFFEIATIPTASVLFRNRLFHPPNHSHGDFLLYCELLSEGKAGYINETMAAYRLHGGGISSAYDSNAYLEKRIGELVIEKKIAFFSTAVKTETDKILTAHTLHYLNKNRRCLSASQKKYYTGILLQCQSFYTQNWKAYGTLLRTLFK